MKNFARSTFANVRASARRFTLVIGSLVVGMGVGCYVSPKDFNLDECVDACHYEYEKCSNGTVFPGSLIFPVNIVIINKCKKKDEACQIACWDSDTGTGSSTDPTNDPTNITAPTSGPVTTGPVGDTTASGTDTDASTSGTDTDSGSGSSTTDTSISSTGTSATDSGSATDPGSTGTTGAPPDTCGDGNLDPGEPCDGANNNGKTCDDLVPGSTGDLKCVKCAFNTQFCKPPSPGLDPVPDPLG